MLDLIIVGAGTAGLSAAVYARRAGLDVIVIEKGMPGGQIVNSPEVENYPAIKKTSGFEFVQALIDQSTTLGAEIVYEEIASYNLLPKVKTVTTEQQIYTAKAVIIANGAKHKLLGAKGEEQFSGLGVSYCATCDGAFFRGKPVVVIGGGNTALEETLFLANMCSSVYVVHRRDSFRGDEALVSRVKEKDNITLVMNSVIVEVVGDGKVNSVIVKDVETGENRTIDVNGVFIAIGLAPDNDIFKEVLDLDDEGYFISNEDCTTRVDGVYVAGDSRQKKVRQLITAASDGAVAATMAAGYISSMK